MTVEKTPSADEDLAKSKAPEQTRPFELTMFQQCRAEPYWLFK